MGKNRHSKDKLYIVASEYNRDWGGFKDTTKRLPFRCLPFYCCGLSLLPFKEPVCTTDGIVFDATHIFAYIDCYRRNPVTGKPLQKKDLIPLRFHKNSQGEYHCPVTYKQFNEYSYIVANKKTGHVYSNDAIDALCRRPQSWFDLLTNEPFTPSDLIVIQNPRHLDCRQIEGFEYIKSGRAVPKPKLQESVEGIALEEGALDPTIKATRFMAGVMDEAKASEVALKLKHNQLIPNVHNTVHTGSLDAPVDDPNETVDGKDTASVPVAEVNTLQKDVEKKHTLFTTHRQAASFTSTQVNVSYDTEYRPLTSQESRAEMYKAVKGKKKKGYVRLQTTLGALNFELHCDKAPEACYNFLKHCASGYYKDTIFHRSIPNFMIQGGDPTGTGTGGVSAFGADEPQFKDEFHPHLVHKGAGILSMANSGANTNRSQFFVTYKTCEHLNNLHSVFGRLVGGMETLKKMEALPVGRHDRPLDPPKIIQTIVFQDPFKDFLEAQQREKEEAEKLASLPEYTKEQLLDPMYDHEKRGSEEVGKYLDGRALSSSQQKRSFSTQNPPSAVSALAPHIKKQLALHQASKSYSFSSW